MTTSDELSCQELVNLITSYLEMTLLPDDTRRVDAHLATCAGCAIYLEQMRRTVNLVGMLRYADVPAEAKGRLLVAFRDWRQGA